MSERREPWRTGDPKDRLAALRHMVEPNVWSTVNPLAITAVLATALALLVVLVAGR